MPQSTRILFVAGAVTPFSDFSSTASLVQSLPNGLQNAGDFEVRIMMPCYKAIDEREHNLHEVIRLSGTEVPMGSETESVSVKVASMPDAPMQVYFMEHDSYFDRNGRTADAEGNEYDDNARRALFFNRSVLETIRKLRWGPDLIHSFGWISAFTPSLLATTYDGDDLFSDTKSIFTPDDERPQSAVSSAFAESMGLSLDGSRGSTLPEIGLQFSDGSILPPDGAALDGAPKFGDDTETRGNQLVSLYDQMLSEVPA